MPKLLQAENVSQLSLITIFVHDCRFDKAQIAFDAKTMILKIPFSKEAPEKKTKVKEFFILKKYQIPMVEYLLKIQGVDGYQLVEGNQEGPGTDDFFNKIEFDPQKNELWVSTIIAKGIKIKIRKFDICIEDTNKVLKKVSRYSVS